MSTDLSPLLKEASAERARGLSELAHSLADSAILSIATEVRAKLAAGESLINLTIGDFGPDFQIPAPLAAGIKAAIDAGDTNYPPATGVLSCREAICEHIERSVGLKYPLDSVLVAGGARPLIASAYLSLVNPGDKIVYGLPSWNNEYYASIVRADAVELNARAEDNFFFRPEQLRPHLSDARVVALCSPSNPTGTVMSAEALTPFCEMILEENARRKTAGQPALYLLFDMVYWMLSFPGATHVNPVQLFPDMAKYTIMVDAVSKGMAGTGLRVGWGVGPTDVMAKMAVLLTHLGAWAPKAEQVATAAFLRDPPALQRFLEGMREGLLSRLSKIAEAIQGLAKEGWPVEVIPPQGSVFMSIRVDLKGKRRADGSLIESDEDTRRFLLERAGVALIPFWCFGLKDGDGWFRVSAGAVSVADCEALGPRLSAALAELQS